ncbi:hypothetical protein QE152_g24602 [Popillia japonica]|uniref:Uncharacterized protein n=1 Tax=Popillia japonica TaxID=7064 RepID=A0AAW1K4S7_POPJA
MSVTRHESNSEIINDNLINSNSALLVIHAEIQKHQHELKKNTTATQIALPSLQKPHGDETNPISKECAWSSLQKPHGDETNPISKECAWSWKHLTEDPHPRVRKEPLLRQ